MNESDIIDMLGSRHAPPEWAYFAQVRNQAGFRTRIRTLDAVAMSLFPSRGIAIHGFEIKVSRPDWLRELKSPHKAEEIASDLDYFWIVTPDDIVKKHEIPDKWGHLVVKNSIRAVKSAVPLRDIDVDVSRRFVASLLRSAQNKMNYDHDEITKLIDELKKRVAHLDCSLNGLSVVYGELEKERKTETPNKEAQDGSAGEKTA